MSFVVISWNQERRNHSSQLLCQVSILLSSVFRCTFSWILGEEEWEMFNFQCTLLSTAWFSNTRYRRVCRKWLRFPGMTGTKSWLFQSVLIPWWSTCIYSETKMGVLAASSSSCLPQWSLFVLPELLVFLGPEPQWAPNHHSGKYQLMCWLQILPLEQALPKTMLGFSKMHSSVSGWISGVSLIAVGWQVPDVILVFPWLSSSIVALALLLYDSWIQTIQLYCIYFMRSWISLSYFWLAITFFHGKIMHVIFS